MSKPHFIKVLLFVSILLMAAPLRADEQAARANGNININKGPIVITARSLSSDSRANTALFEGNVTAKTDDIELYADRMLVSYGQQGGVERIAAEGTVKLIKGPRAITAGKADYTRADDKIIFSENPMVAEGRTLITGSRITYWITEDRTLVNDSKMFIESK